MTQGSFWPCSQASIRPPPSRSSVLPNRPTASKLSPLPAWLGTVQQVKFSIYNQSTGQWWNGTNFQGASVSLPASLSGVNWAPASGVALPPSCCGQYYRLTASATDTYTHIGTTNITVQADSVPPVATFSPLSNGQTVSNLSSIGGSVTDNFGLVASVVFSIHEQDINYGTGRWWNGTNFQGSLAMLPASVSGTSWAPAAGVLLPPLNSGQHYDLTVMATDTTSNSASSTITVQEAITVLSWDPGQTPLGTAVLQRRQLLVPNHPARPRRRGLAHGTQCARRAGRGLYESEFSAEHLQLFLRLG